MLNFDFPLSSRARTYLKLEQIFKYCEEARQLNSIYETLAIVRNIIDYLNLVDGVSAIKIDLSRDIEKCDTKLRVWLEDPEADKDLVSQLRAQIQAARQALAGFTRQRTTLKDDPLIEVLKPRFLTPAGANCFDTPLFEFWVHQPVQTRRDLVQKWMYELDCLRLPVYTVLYLWRLCSESQQRVAHRGFMQERAENCELINIQYSKQILAYPVVSGSQNNINIRFFPFQKGATMGDIEFDITYIKGSLL